MPPHTSVPLQGSCPISPQPTSMGTTGTEDASYIRSVPCLLLPKALCVHEDPSMCLILLLLLYAPSWFQLPHRDCDSHSPGEVYSWVFKKQTETNKLLRVILMCNQVWKPLHSSMILYVPSTNTAPLRIHWNYLFPCSFFLLFVKSFKAKTLSHSPSNHYTHSTMPTILLPLTILMNK